MGRTADFRNTVVIMTSNIGSQHVLGGGAPTIGFTVDKEEVTEQSYEQMQAKALDELKRVFRPELLNRIDEVVVFLPLQLEHMQQIVGLMIDKTRKKPGRAQHPGHADRRRVRTAGKGRLRPRLRRPPAPPRDPAAGGQRHLPRHPGRQLPRRRHHRGGRGERENRHAAVRARWLTAIARPGLRGRAPFGLRRRSAAFSERSANILALHPCGTIKMPRLSNACINRGGKRRSERHFGVGLRPICDLSPRNSQVDLTDESYGESVKMKFTGEKMNWCL